MTGTHQEAEDVQGEGWKISMKARRGRRVREMENRTRVKKENTTMWHGAIEQMKRRGRGDIEGTERMRAIALWRRDSPLSGPQEACQGLNDITLHVIYFIALGGCPMCQKMHKILTAILTIHYSWPVNTLNPHLERGIKQNMLNTENELITWCFNCSTLIALVHRITNTVRR